MTYLKKAINLRKELSPYFKKSGYVDDRDILYISKRINIRHWRLLNGSNLCVLANLDRIADVYFEVLEKDATNSLPLTQLNFKSWKTILNKTNHWSNFNQKKSICRDNGRLRSCPPGNYRLTD